MVLAGNTVRVRRNDMQEFMKTDAAKMLASWARVFASAVIALYLSGVTDWTMLVNAGIAALLPVILRWLNPKDAAYGRQAPAPVKPAAKKAPAKKTTTTKK